MFGSPASLLLIAAIIACPMWCGSGCCQTEGCCAFDEVQAERCPEEAAEACCCDSSVSQQSRTDQKRHLPVECPRQFLCQGICGGAVLEKPCELVEFSTVTLLAVPRCGMPMPQDLPASCASRAKDDIHGGSNVGRFMRTIHMSLLN